MCTLILNKNNDRLDFESPSQAAVQSMFIISEQNIPKEDFDGRLYDEENVYLGRVSYTGKFWDKEKKWGREVF